MTFVGISSNGYVTLEDGSTHYDPVAACDHWATLAEETQARLDRAVEALRRLGSTEGFIGAISVDPSHPLWVELAARGEFAQNVVAEIEESG